MKRASCFLSASLLLSNAGAYAAVGDCCPPAPCHVETCCPEINDCCECNVCPPNYEVTPNAGPCVKDGANIFVTADFIYWTAREDNLDFAITKDIDIDPAKGRFVGPETRWRPGFKVGVGHDFCYDGWDIFAEYTWYRVNNTRESIDAPSGFVLLDIFWFVNGLFYFSGTGDWTLDFNVVDFELGRNFYVSPRLTLRPFCGLKGTWQKQHIFVNLSSVIDFTMNNRMKNWGIGILAGLDTSWHWTREVSLFAHLAATALWEQFKCTRSDFVVIDSVSIHTLNLLNRFHIVRPVIEWMLGLRWETWFHCDEYHVALEGGWEAQIWFSQNEFIRSANTSAGRGGDLTLQGLTLQARLDF